ncbi:MAG TPA: hypothetical protein VK859_06450 [bacterium]|jgi:hypothetical protein|nr:hypothetical protein [bacterium]
MKFKSFLFLALLLVTVGLMVNACSSPKSPTNPGNNSPTDTPTITNTPVNTGTSTATGTPSKTFTATATATITSTPTLTATATSTLSPTITYTPTNTPSPTSTQTPTSTPTVTPTPTITDTPTITSTPSNTGTPTQTLTPTNTVQYSPTDTPTPTATWMGVPFYYTATGITGSVNVWWDCTCSNNVTDIYFPPLMNDPNLNDNDGLPGPSVTLPFTTATYYLVSPTTSDQLFIYSPVYGPPGVTLTIYYNGAPVTTFTGNTTTLPDTSEFSVTYNPPD